MDSHYNGVNVTTSWMSFQGAGSQGDWHCLGIFSKRAVVYDEFWIPVGLRVYLKDHINASLQNCLTSTIKPAPHGTQMASETGLVRPVRDQSLALPTGTSPALSTAKVSG